MSSTLKKFPIYREMNKTLHRNDTQLTPFTMTKEWVLSNTLTDNLVLTEAGNTVALEYIDYGYGSESTPIINISCSVAMEQQPSNKAKLRNGEKRNGLFYSELEPQNVDGTFTRLVYDQVKGMFYNNYRDPSKMWGMEMIDFDKSKTRKFLADKLRLFDIPTIVFGEKILPKSIEIRDNSLDNNFTIFDDGNCNLFAGVNLFAKQQEVGDFYNTFVTGSDINCAIYFSFGDAPTAPINLRATLIAFSSASYTASLHWTITSDNEIGFVLERALSGSAFTSSQVLGPGVSAALDTNVVANAIYFYRVYAYNAQGSSSYSNTASLLINPLVSYEPWEEYAVNQFDNFNSGSGWAGSWVVAPNTTGKVSIETWERFPTGQNSNFNNNNTIYGWSGGWYVANNYRYLTKASQSWDAFTTGQTSNFSGEFGWTGNWFNGVNYRYLTVASQSWDAFITGQTTNFTGEFGWTGNWKTQISGS